MGFFDNLRTDANTSTTPAPARRVRDPVCGMRIQPERAAGSSAGPSGTIHFCSVNCKNRFDANPSMYGQ